MTENFNSDFNRNAQGPSNVFVPNIRDKDGTGYDIFSLLLKERVIVVQDQVNSAMASVIIAQLKWLDRQIGPKGQMNEPITMLVNSPGGSVIDGLAIVDVMRDVKSPIRTIGTGMQASMGSIILVAGDERAMHPHSKVLVHQIMGGAQGGTQHSDFQISERNMADLHEELKQVYVEFTGLNHKFWDAAGERDTWLTAEQAIEIGYVHGLTQSGKSGGKYAAEAVRPIAEQNESEVATKKRIAEMPLEDVLRHLNNGQANKGEFGGYRPELVVRLASFAEMWVPSKQKENGIQLAANQNGKTKKAALKP